jgi:hypothetical protein
MFFSGCNRYKSSLKKRSNGPVIPCPPPPRRVNSGGDCLIKTKELLKDEADAIYRNHGRIISLCTNTVFQQKTRFLSKEIPRSSRGMTGSDGGPLEIRDSTKK